MSICRSPNREIDDIFPVVSAILLIVLLFILQVIMLPNGPLVPPFPRGGEVQIAIIIRNHYWLYVQPTGYPGPLLLTAWISNHIPSKMFSKILKVDTPYLTHGGKIWGIICEFIAQYSIAVERIKMVSIYHGGTDYLVWLKVPFSDNSALAMQLHIIYHYVGHLTER